jgi:hypothetical protein
VVEHLPDKSRVPSPNPNPTKSVWGGGGNETGRQITAESHKSEEDLTQSNKAKTGDRSGTMEGWGAHEEPHDRGRV